MRRSYLIPFAFLLATGCGSNPEPVVKDRVAAINEVCIILEGVKDDQSAAEASAKLDKAVARLNELDKKLQDYKPDDRSKAQEKHKKDADDALQRLLKAGFAAGASAPGKAGQLRDAVDKGLPGTDAVPLAMELLIGKWEPAEGMPKGPFGLAVVEFKRDGAVSMSVGPLSLNGRYRFLGRDEIETTIDMPGKGATQKIKIEVTKTSLTTTNDKGKVDKLKRKL